MLVRAEESYNNIIGQYKSICNKKNVSQINPETVQLHVKVKEEKLNDVKKLLRTHYGDNWEDMPQLDYYKNVFSRTQHNHNNADEECEFDEEGPGFII